MIEVLKHALEALEYPLNTSHEGFNVDMAELLSHRAITSLRQAIADLEKQEPVAWMTEWENGEWSPQDKPNTGKRSIPLYTHPQPKAEQSPLTDEQISDLWCKVSNTDFVTADTHVFARAIEAAHGIGDKA